MTFLSAGPPLFQRFLQWNKAETAAGSLVGSKGHGGWPGRHEPWFSMAPSVAFRCLTASPSMTATWKEESRAFFLSNMASTESAPACRTTF